MQLVADANVLLSAVIGGRAALVLRHEQVEQVFTPASAYDEVFEYLAPLAKKKRLHLDTLLLTLAALPVTVVERSEYEHQVPEAKRRIAKRDLPLSFGGKDQSLSNVEVVLTNRVTQLSGAVADDHARPAPGATVIACSIDRDRWYPGSRFLRKTIAGSDGLFSAEGLPQGNYYVTPIAQAPATGEDGWQDRDFLESLVPRASTVALNDGQTASLSLQLSR